MLSVPPGSGDGHVGLSSSFVGKRCDPVDRRGITLQRVQCCSEYVGVQPSCLVLPEKGSLAWRMRGNLLGERAV